MKRTVKESLKILYALPPYNVGSNVCAHDGLFARSIARDYSLEEINQACDELGIKRWEPRV